MCCGRTSKPPDVYKRQVFALLSYGLNQITMSQGFSGTAMRSVMLGAAVNIALDPVFIFALHMGVRGAALATVLSQACSTVYIPVSYTHLDSWPVGQLAAFFGGLVIVGATVYVVCWRIGVGIYRKREL